MTLSKKKAKADAEEGGDAGKTAANTLEAGYLPKEQEVDTLLENPKYSTMIKASKDKNLVGRVHKFRVLESQDNSNYMVVKSTDAEKKSKNFIAILPRCLVTNFSPTISNQLSSEEVYEGLVLELLFGQIPVISLQPELIALKDDILKKTEDNNDQLRSGSTYIGVVNGVVKGG